ncbi:gamma-glutamylcyclotransferase [Legionella longbeachae]|uniref:gamma-glutamylcyclotransferase family protein n=1 Tax=Legionella longbeachae TaxID=450 RepID=UPI0009B74F52|nr:gamma-glutamylcyclotransferase family protein [Legionella longbeachae]ARB92987.1 gamma-glutamylcyclotransferase [Legionella longbeachae]RZV26640.1 gamma-glutamylcyclotransferase [Legionella longbeachae]UAK47119.1 gamma-glutamylcyclotransferase [Legionella longbeachae]VEE04180.1 AIG2-like family [Legionella oakridgensis]
MYHEKIFSYGTLQFENVQIANFGRKLDGCKDILSEFELSTLEIKDPDVVATSGEKIHPIITYTGNPEHQVIGTVFEISFEELIQADSYEVSDYKRIKVQLDSGVFAWAYVNAEISTDKAQKTAVSLG